MEDNDTMTYVENAIYEDKEGNIITADQLDEFSPWEIEERGIHVVGEMS